MESIKKIMVLLDMSSMDETLINYAAFIGDIQDAECIYFINIVKRISLPEDIKKEFPDLEKKALKERKSLIKKKVHEIFSSEKSIDIKYHIEFGTQLKASLIFAEKESIDLILIGQKKVSEGTGVLAQRLARRASCSLLIVPEGIKPSIKRLLVPIDFSYYCQLSLEQAIYISNVLNNNIEIICQNVFNVPVGYHYTGKSYEEFTEIMKKNAQKDYKLFIKNINTQNANIKTVYSLDTNDNLASDIQDLSKQLDADITIIGAKGRTATAALFLGSLSEKLIHSHMDKPLMVIRPKGKNVGLLESLREI